MRKLRFVALVVGPVLVLAGAVETARWAFPSPAQNRTAPEPGRAAPLKASESPTLAGLQAKRVLLDASDIGRIENIAASGSWVILISRADGLSALNIKTGRRVSLRSFASSNGINPSFTRVAPAAQPSTFLISDRTGGRIVKFRLPDNATSLDSVESHAVTGIEGIWSSSIELAGNTFITSGIHDDRLANMYKTDNGQPTAPLPVGAPLFPEVTAPSVLSVLNRNAIAAHPSGNLFAQAFRFSSRIHIYDLNGRLMNALSGPVDVKLVYNTAFDPAENTDRFISDKQMRYCYVDVAADGTFIYALFAGRALGEYSGAFSYGDQLHVFSWAGAFVGAWKLDTEGLNLAVHPTSRTLLLNHRRPTPQIVEFDLAPVYRRAAGKE